jgi:hypothetical protein
MLHWEDQSSVNADNFIWHQEWEEGRKGKKREEGRKEGMWMDRAVDSGVFKLFLKFYAWWACCCTAVLLHGSTAPIQAFHCGNTFSLCAIVKQQQKQQKQSRKRLTEKDFWHLACFPTCLTNWMQARGSQIGLVGGVVRKSIQTLSPPPSQRENVAFLSLFLSFNQVVSKPKASGGGVKWMANGLGEQRGGELYKLIPQSRDDEQMEFAYCGCAGSVIHSWLVVAHLSLSLSPSLFLSFSRRFQSRQPARWANVLGCGWKKRYTSSSSWLCLVWK